MRRHEENMMEGRFGTSPLYPKLRWLLIPVVTAHNFEEWLTFPRSGATAFVLTKQ